MLEEVQERENDLLQTQTDIALCQWVLNPNNHMEESAQHDLIQRVNKMLGLRICSHQIQYHKEKNNAIDLQSTNGSYLRQSLAIDTYKWLFYVKIHDNSKLNELYVDEEDIGLNFEPDSDGQDE
ncbi:Hypothetical_protein [Hexamita inflata]|uniref:Hypothetical_protein n=1 Tax=Hexamita inflata TaxID=28002 RepID=A0AA86V3N8_9EUKA|nr:Hypothetical protein HINF_LOCUS62627 [Hexamita inflata]